MSPLVAALDLGTTGVKCSVIGLEAGIVASSYVEHQLSFPGRDRAEQDPRVLEEAMWEALSLAISAVPDAKARVACISVTSARATFVGVSGREPVTPFIMWQDQRSISVVERVEADFGADRYYDITHLPIDPVATGSKARWIAEHDPNTFKDITRFLTAQGYALRLLGAARDAVHSSMAAYYGTLDAESLSWDESLMEIFGLRSGVLPEVVTEPEVVGSLAEAAAVRIGLKADVPLVCAPSDWVCTHVGANALDGGDALIYLGTGGAFGVRTNRPIVDPERRFSCLPHVDEGSYLLEGLLISGAAGYRWARDLLIPSTGSHKSDAQVDSYAMLEELALESAPGSRGVLMVPSLMGSGAPRWNSFARGSIFGIGLDTTRADIARAVVEGVSLDVAALLDTVVDMGVEVSSVVVTGPPANSILWREVLSNVLDLEIRTVSPADPTMSGAAACAMVALGLTDDMSHAAQSVIDEGHSRLPDAATRDLYAQLRSSHIRITEALDLNGIHETMATTR